VFKLPPYGHDILDQAFLSVMAHLKEAGITPNGDPDQKLIRTLLSDKLSNYDQGVNARIEKATPEDLAMVITTPDGVRHKIRFCSKYTCAKAFQVPESDLTTAHISAFLVRFHHFFMQATKAAPKKASVTSRLNRVRFTILAAELGGVPQLGPLTTLIRTLELDSVKSDIAVELKIPVLGPISAAPKVVSIELMRSVLSSEQMARVNSAVEDQRDQSKRVLNFGSVVMVPTEADTFAEGGVFKVVH
jgi:hypothetical protein